jgi:hypothetical protein
MSMPEAGTDDPAQPAFLPTGSQCGDLQEFARSGSGRDLYVGIFTRGAFHFPGDLFLRSDPKPPGAE